MITIDEILAVAGQVGDSKWENQLKHQISVLPSFQFFLSELPHVLNWLIENK